MLRLILALTDACKTATEHAAEGNLDRGSSLRDDMVTDSTRPIKRIPEKFCCATARPRKLEVFARHHQPNRGMAFHHEHSDDPSSVQRRSRIPL
jgi:hypothetical protein